MLCTWIAHDSIYLQKFNFNKDIIQFNGFLGIYLFQHDIEAK